MKAIRRADMADFGRPYVYQARMPRQQAIRQQRTVEPTGHDIYIGGAKPGLWQSGWRAVLVLAPVVLLCAVAWTLIFMAVSALGGR
jgi:hypothetical protein